MRRNRAERHPDRLETPEASAAPPPAPGLGRLLGLVRPFLGGLLLATGVMLVHSGLSLITPWVAGHVVDAALLEKDLERLDRIVLGLVGLFAAMGLLSFLELYLVRRAGALLLEALRLRLYGHLLDLSPEFFDRRRVGELLSRIGSDLTVVQGALTDQLPEGLRAALSFAGTLVLLLVLHTKLTLVALALVPPVVLLAVLWGGRLERLSSEVQDALAESASIAEETIAGIRTVQSFGRERHEHERYAARIATLVRLQLRNARLFGGFVGVLHFSAFSAFAVVLWYGGRLILAGEMTPGQLTSFLLYTFTIAFTVGTLGGLYAAYRQLRGASARIFEILDTRPAVEDAPQAEPLRDPRGRIELRGVRFHYPSAEGRAALEDIDLTVEPGEMLGIVGPSGSGKSTLFSLLLRFRDPTEGSITLGGQDLRAVRVAELRRNLGIVPQEIVLFNGTVAENLRYGRLDASDEQVRAAARAAGAEAFIRELPRGWDELVGERGVKLSAGQRQRIAIARVFLRDPAIVLLDEATSSLDPDSEQLVQEALGRLLHGRTTLVIAHRLATAHRADRIVVLERGRIAAVGRHEALYAANALYRRYWELQSLQHELPPDALVPSSPVLEST